MWYAWYMPKKSLIFILAILVMLLVALLISFDTFQGQPVISFGKAGCLQHCADGSWKWFSDPDIRWTDGNLHLITEGEYRGGY